MSSSKCHPAGRCRLDPRRGATCSSKHNEALTAAFALCRVSGSIAPDIVSYNILISACSHGNNLQDASSLLSRISSAGLEANIETFVALMSIALRQSRPDVVCDIWDCLQSSKAVPDQSSIALYIQGLIAQVRFALSPQHVLLRCFKSLRQSHEQDMVRPMSCISLAVLSLRCNPQPRCESMSCVHLQGRCSAALRLVRSILESSEVHPASMLAPCSIAALMACLLHDGDPLGVLQLFVEAQLVGTPSDFACVCVLQSALGHVTQPELMSTDLLPSEDDMRAAAATLESASDSHMAEQGLESELGEDMAALNREQVIRQVITLLPSLACVPWLVLLGRTHQSILIHSVDTQLLNSMISMSSTIACM
jgi:pentatricopeptide repeat protein